MKIEITGLPMGSVEDFPYGCRAKPQVLTPFFLKKNGTHRTYLIHSNGGNALEDGDVLQLRHSA
jgi:hypothetical protein